MGATQERAKSMGYNNFTETYDYLVIGGGAAGAILANRLSASGDYSVCLLEAGPWDRHPFIHIPAGFVKMIFNPAYTWQFTTEPNELTLNRRIPIPQGRVLGGSTSINGLIHNRGQRDDYDHWARLGNTGWDYESLLPYFKRTEHCFAYTTEYRGQNGLMPVTDTDWTHPLADAFIAGAEGFGLPRNEDYNGLYQEGVGYFQRTIYKGRRMSTAQTYLKAAKHHKNLHIKTNTQVTRILIENGRATGVEYVENRGQSTHRIAARREVILCAGAINTPKLLQLSGIGEPEHLQSLGLPVLHSLPGVGQNLKDHYSVRVVARVKNSRTINELAKGIRLGGQILNWVLRRPSILALSPSLVYYFWKSDEALSTPDLQGVFTPASYKEGYVGVLDDYPGMTCGVWQHRPRSSGFVRITSSDPLAVPMVQPNYLQDPYDRETLIKGIRLARRLLMSEKLSFYMDGEVLPGSSTQSDEELLAFARRFGVSSYHLNGTAKMGPADDGMAVVDPQLRVHGLQQLRIADSSVMPEIPSANICAATMMIAEKAADLILESPQVP